MTPLMSGGQNMKVMIVDDNADVRKLIRAVLEDVAEEFIECSDGEQAVLAYERQRPDWTVMDVTMKVMDGVTATRLITSKFPEAQIIIVTQYDNPKLRDRAQEAGAARFLIKENLMELRPVLAASRADFTNPQN